MGHLSLETLARLVDEAPSAQERAHLESCALCREELCALERQTEGLGALPDLRPPAGDWDALEARLTAEGLVRSRAARWRSAGGPSQVWLQAAAALVLFLGGSALGPRLWSAMGPGGESAGPPAGLELIPVGTQAEPAADLTQAAEAVRLAERQFIDALVQYRQILDAQGQPSLIGNPAARLAALQGIVAAGRAAVQQAPADPFMNGVLVGALAEQEALLRTASLPGREGIF
jgi:hypothetical protein